MCPQGRQRRECRPASAASAMLVLRLRTNMQALPNDIVVATHIAGGEVRRTWSARGEAQMWRGPCALEVGQQGGDPAAAARPRANACWCRQAHRVGA